VQVFKNDLRSYRDLPYRVAEFGKVHRYEPSGALHGLMRVRAQSCNLQPEPRDSVQ
jgi:threonyl-tRNA synthetase